MSWAWARPASSGKLAQLLRMVQFKYPDIARSTNRFEAAVLSELDMLAISPV